MRLLNAILPIQVSIPILTMQHIIVVLLLLLTKYQYNCKYEMYLYLMSVSTCTTYLYCFKYIEEQIYLKYICTIQPVCCVSAYLYHVPNQYLSEVYGYHNIAKSCSLLHNQLFIFVTFPHSRSDHWDYEQFTNKCNKLQTPPYLILMCNPFHQKSHMQVFSHKFHWLVFIQRMSTRTSFFSCTFGII